MHVCIIFVILCLVSIIFFVLFVILFELEKVYYNFIYVLFNLCYFVLYFVIKVYFVLCVKYAKFYLVFHFYNIFHFISQILFYFIFQCFYVSVIALTVLPICNLYIYSYMWVKWSVMDFSPANVSWPLHDTKFESLA